MLQVQFPDSSRYVAVDQIEHLGDQRLTPLDMVAAGKFGRPSDLRRTLAHFKLTGRLQGVIYSMDIASTDFYAYQFKPVLKILQSPTNGILVADEVGLLRRTRSRAVHMVAPAPHLIGRWRVGCPGETG